MKKKFWMLGMAVMALASCTQNEVLDVPESRVIGFDTFVGKNSRAIKINQAGPEAPTTKDNLYQFWVFGYENEEQTFTGTDNAAKVYYNTTNQGFTYANHQIWALGATYSFAAYSNANKPLLNINTEINYDTPVSNITELKVAHTLLNVNDLTEGSQLVFTDYEVGDDDLLAAIVKPTVLPSQAQQVEDVPLVFQHLLSCVNFTIQNNSEAFYLQIDDITVEGITKDCCTYKISKDASSSYVKSCMWNNMDGNPSNDDENESNGYTFSSGIGTGNSGGLYLAPGATLNMMCFVIPQSNQKLTNVSINSLTYTKEGNVYTQTTAINNTHTISLAINDNIHKIWQPGYQYNYVISMSGTAHYIHFTANVTDWINHNATSSTTE